MNGRARRARLYRIRRAAESLPARGRIASGRPRDLAPPVEFDAAPEADELREAIDQRAAARIAGDRSGDRVR